jgi:hypothetical protein
MRGESRKFFEIIVVACLVMLGQVVRFGEAFCMSTMFEARDSRGNFCSNGNYDSGNMCGVHDDVDFTAHQMCCDAYDCQTQADTSTFTASSMCCACGGGMRWIPQSLPSDVKMRCVDKHVTSSDRV